MTTTFKTIAGIVILAGVVGLTACDSSGGKTAENSAAASAVPAAEATASSQPQTSASPDPTAVADPTAAAESAAPDAVSSNAPSSPQASTKQLKELLQLAKQGKVPGVEYAAHSGVIDDVEAAWGEPDSKERAGKGTYSTYSDKHVVFGFNKGDQIFDVRSSAADLQKLTLKEIKQALGKPANTAVNGSDKIYIYQAGEQYQLKFIIPDSTGTVDHISVFSEHDSFNNMAG